MPAQPIVIPAGSPISPGGYGPAAPGPRGQEGAIGPDGPAAISTDVLNAAKLGNDNLLYVPQGWPGFIEKSSAYTLTPADSGKLIVCSGGEWFLSLPTPVRGMVYRVKNEQGLSRSESIIGIDAGVGRTINGLSRFGAIFSEQECTLITDGVNWRTFGLARALKLGELDATNVANLTIRLPNGYSSFELQFDRLSGSGSPNFQARVSSDGGTNFAASAGYYGMYFFNNTATTMAVGTHILNFNEWYLTHWVETVSRHPLHVTIYPGGTDTQPQFLADSGTWNSISARFASYGFYNVFTRINALRVWMSVGNIGRVSVTVKGFV